MVNRGEGPRDVNAIAAGPDGTVWAAAESGLWRFDAGGWKNVVAGVVLYDVDVASDGTVWLVGTFGAAYLDKSLSAL